ncbi:MAG: hypothetical protein HYV07_06350 [Deltaproteobacteria bacterium]|nr:hypothetical protein [Deltaproteobacteria bacterium]
MRTLSLAPLLLVACQSGPRTIIVPSDAIADPSTPARSAVAPYVIRMTDGQRTWQIEIPSVEATGAFEASIPLDLSKPLEPDPTGAGEVRPVERSDEPDAAYLESLARVGDLYRKKQYELALAELLKLEAKYPDDERVLEMKGTLFVKLKKPELARAAWERALAKNPDNTTVAAALSTLSED